MACSVCSPSAVWDEDGVRDEVRTFALEHLGTSQAIVAIDETSFPKRGRAIGGRQRAVLRHHRPGAELSGGRLSR